MGQVSEFRADEFADGFAVSDQPIEEGGRILMSKLKANCFTILPFFKLSRMFFITCRSRLSMKY